MSDEATRDRLARVMGGLLNRWDVVDESGPLEWHECDDCPAPGDVCPCSGIPWARRELVDAVLKITNPEAQG